MNWMAYNKLAWTDDILAPPETYEEETLIYVEAIKSRISVQNVTMLHLGCGAGGHDFHFKKHFSVTGADISEGMLALAKKRNPEVTYVKGDMRTIDLNRKFDVVVIPDSIMYMTTLEDLKKTIMNADLTDMGAKIIPVPGQNYRSWRKILEADACTIYPAHGKPFPAEKMQSTWTTTARKTCNPF